MRRLVIIIALLMLTGCGGSVQPTQTLPPIEPSSPPTEVVQVVPTNTVAIPPTNTIAPTAKPTLAMLDLPTSLPPEAPTPTIANTPTPLSPSANDYIIPGFEYDTSNHRPVCYEIQLNENDQTQLMQCFFETFYQARSMPSGGNIDVATFYSLVDGAYADYTMPLVNDDVEKAERGELLEARFSDISVKVLEYQKSTDYSNPDHYVVEVTRTRTNVTSTGEESNTQTLKFRVAKFSDILYADDFFNPGSNNWVSATIPLSTAQLQPEVENFFKQFYLARSAEPNQRIDLEKTTDLTNFAYRAYTLPLLQQQAIEVEEGKITAVSYSGIKVELLDYDPFASEHGGLATTRVTRTQHITHADGTVTATTVTNQFRVHRHFDERGAGRWFAVDFFQPDAQQWVSEISGLSVPLPANFAA